MKFYRISEEQLRLIAERAGATGDPTVLFNECTCYPEKCLEKMMLNISASSGRTCATCEYYNTDCYAVVGECKHHDKWKPAWQQDKTTTKEKE